MRGSHELNLNIQPYYTILNESITYIAPTTSNPGGSISATFTVGKHNTTRAVDLVGVYISPTYTVDHQNKFTIANSIIERSNTTSGTGVRNQIDGNLPITIVVPLPSNVHQTPSPERRNLVYVRIGVKSASITERVYTHVYEIPI
jgi:hypothetical protein